MQKVGIRHFSREKCKVVQDKDRSEFQEVEGIEREEEEDRLQSNLRDMDGMAGVDSENFI